MTAFARLNSGITSTNTINKAEIDAALEVLQMEKERKKATAVSWMPSHLDTHSNPITSRCVMSTHSQSYDPSKL